MFDAETGQPIVGAVVELLGADLRANTEEDGGYLIRHIPPECETIIVFATGYTTQTLRCPHDSPGVTSRADVRLKTDSPRRLGSILGPQPKHSLADWQIDLGAGFARDVICLPGDKSDVVPVALLATADFVPYPQFRPFGLKIRGGYAGRRIDGKTILPIDSDFSTIELDAVRVHVIPYVMQAITPLHVSLYPGLGLGYHHARRVIGEVYEEDGTYTVSYLSGLDQVFSLDIGYGLTSSLRLLLTIDRPGFVWSWQQSNDYDWDDAAGRYVPNGTSRNSWSAGWTKYGDIGLGLSVVYRVNRGCLPSQ